MNEDALGINFRSSVDVSSVHSKLSDFSSQSIDKVFCSCTHSSLIACVQDHVNLLHLAAI